MSRKKQRPPNQTPVKTVAPSKASTPPFAGLFSAAAVRPWLFYVLLAVVGIAIYLPAIDGPFILDDFDLMEVASAVRGGDFRVLLGTGRPLLIASFRWSYDAIGGFTPTTWFHLPSMLLHVLNAVLLSLFWRSVCGVESIRSETSAALQKLLIYGVPLLFLVLPIQAESVAYISSRAGVMSTTFYLAALWIFASPLRLRQRWTVALGLLALTGGAALTKQDKVTLPAAVLLLDYLVLSGRDWRAVLRSWPTYLLFIFSGVAGFFLVIKPVLFVPSAGFTLNWVTYLFTQFRMYFLYLRLVFLPVGLNLDRDITPSTHIFEYGSWLAMLALIGVVAAVVYLHRRYALLAFSTLFFFLAMAPSSSFYPLLDFYADRHIYLAVAGLLAATFVLADKFLKPSPRLVAPVLLGLGIVYGVATYERATVWGDDLVLWQDTANKSPQKARPWTWLGKTQYERRLVSQAQISWQQAAKVANPKSREYQGILTNLGLSFAKQKDYKQAVVYYKQALEARRPSPVVWAQLAVAQMRLGLADEGWQSFEQASKYGEGLPEVRRLRAQEYYLVGRCADAYDDFLGASLQRPEDDSLRGNLELARKCRDDSQR
jgi:tetratricopeptide (TPR) repeat protein